MMLTLAAGPALAQRGVAMEKKLYCWEQNGQRTCSDTLPQEAIGRARDEISARSGMVIGSVERALTADERASQALAQAEQRARAMQEETRRRTDQAMLSSYQNEAELRRVFNESINMAENNIKTARYNANSLRTSLSLLLARAGASELEGRPVPEKTRTDIQRQQSELRSQLRLLQGLEQQRIALDADITNTLARYRDLKNVQSAN
jgi:hypothetical protein